MKKKNLIIICAVVVLGVVALVVARSMSKSSTIEQDYHIEDIDAVTKLYLSNKFDVNLLLERVGTGDDDTLWLVNEQYPANQPLVDILLETLHDMRIRQHVNRNAVPSIIKNLSVNNIKVEVYQKVYLIDWFDRGIFCLLFEKYGADGGISYFDAPSAFDFPLSSHCSFGEEL